jgi:beta-phosphoglucomutase-like phosphatase (HAD superfamily)
MPISPYLKEAAFDAETTRMMGEVLDQACLSIEDTSQNLQAAREIIAQCIIVLAQSGITDPDILYRSALDALPVARNRAG